MYVPYDDILRRIEQPPRWWCHGVPRYEEFKPGDMHVYAQAGLLVRIECQDCQRHFLVGVPGSAAQLINETGVRLDSLHDDPPHHDNARYQDEADPRCAGNAMSMVVLEIVEAWWRAPMELEGKVMAHLGLWTRLPHLEGLVGD